ncbi:MAG: hypothetical protein ACRDKA_12355 [Actinomycetota bacterium]
MTRWLGIAALVLLVTSACDGESGELTPPDEPNGSGAASLPLRSGEVPGGLEPDPSGTGPIRSIRDVLPPPRRLPNVPPLPDGLRGAFVEGYRRAFAGPEATASSTVVRLEDAQAAAEFLAYVRLLPVGGNAATVEELPATGLGEEGYGWHLRVPESESSGFAWRAGDTVATLTFSGPVGRAGPEVSLPLAERVDGRLA